MNPIRSTKIQAIGSAQVIQGHMARRPPAISFAPPLLVSRQGFKGAQRARSGSKSVLDRLIGEVAFQGPASRYANIESKPLSCFSEFDGALLQFTFDALAFALNGSEDMRRQATQLC
jgi:hypothetical protein